MDNLRAVLGIILGKIPSREVLSDHIRYNNITKENFLHIARHYVKHYSNDELENLYYYMTNEYEKRSGYISGAGRKAQEFEKCVNIFNVIMLFAVRVLEENNGEPVCQYKHLLRWRMTSHELDETVFTTAFFAYRDIHGSDPTRNFSWRPVIRHNNVYLNKILEKGLADNHFHLKGSAPQFPLSWISMMNSVDNTRFRKLIESYSGQRMIENYSFGKEEDPLYISYLKAALIRCFLYSKLVEKEFVIRSSNKFENDKKCEEDVERLVFKLLKGTDEILEYRSRIQLRIEFLQNNAGTGRRKLDYALNGNYSHNVGSFNENNQILSGERWFMYRMFQLIYSKNEYYKKYYNLFYAYLIIKEKMRSELVQTNDNIGFDNFEMYQDRKEDFIENTPFYEYYIRMAVRGTLRNQNIVSLEARIAPKNSAKSNYENIKKLDSILGNDEKLQEKYFYVFHFIKEKDEDASLRSSILCRHYRKRQSLYQQALAIACFREKYHKEARRVRGIDACAKEIGCRPEVFSQVYRYLREHMVYFTDTEWEAELTLKKHPAKVKIEQLALTYHVGEDYLDVVDGLRAIDEAIHFLNLSCGSRLGHALALGVDPKEYYTLKNNRILISQQDYLDNLVWIYFKIQEFHLKGFEDVIIFLREEYEKFFRLIYLNHIEDSFLENVVKNARKHYEHKGYSAYYNSNFSFSIAAYYEAWKLRGDDPECYIQGFFEEKDYDSSSWNRYSTNKEFPYDYDSRFNPECAYLYFLYHYNPAVKIEGNKRIEVKIHYQLIQCIKQIQKGMKNLVAKKGIGIEANPSSNYLIGQFKRYDKQPIFDFYNVGLNKNATGDEECSQILVCVNTDDQGVFSTYLENEYALLTLALEKAKDENGKDKYTRSQIYQWIDDIRQQGLRLSFIPKQYEEENRRNDE